MSGFAPAQLRQHLEEVELLVSHLQEHVCRSPLLLPAQQRQDHSYQKQPVSKLGMEKSLVDSLLLDVMSKSYLAQTTNITEKLIFSEIASFVDTKETSLNPMIHVRICMAALSLAVLQYVLLIALDQ